MANRFQSIIDKYGGKTATKQKSSVTKNQFQAIIDKYQASITAQTPTLKPPEGIKTIAPGNLFQTAAKPSIFTTPITTEKKPGLITSAYNKVNEYLTKLTTPTPKKGEAMTFDVSQRLEAERKGEIPALLTKEYGPQFAEQGLGESFVISEPLSLTKAKLASEPSILEKISIITVAGLSLVPAVGGGGKNAVKAIKAIKALTKEKDIAKVTKMMRELKIGKELIKEYAPIIVKTSEEKEVANLLTKINELNKATKVIPEIAKGVEESKTVIHLPEKNVYAKLTPEEAAVLKNEVKNIPFTAEDKVHLSQLNSVKRAGIKEVTIDEVKNLSPNAKKALEAIPASKVTAPGFNWTERRFITSVKEALPQLKVAGQYVPRDTDRLMIRVANLIKEDIGTAEKMANSGISDNAMAAGVGLIKHYSDEAIKATTQVAKDALNEKAATLANDLARKYTEAGRSVQAASMLSRLTPEGQLRFAAREIQKYNEAIEKGEKGLLGLRKKIPELTKEQAGQILDEMKAISKMAEGEEKLIRFKKLQDYISDLIPTPLFKKIITIWKAGLLTGLKTTGVNIFANVSHAVTENVAKGIGSLVDIVTSFITRKRALSYTFKGMPEGAIEGAKKALRYATTGFDERNIGTKLDYKRINFGKNWFARVLQKYTEIPFRAMGAEDQPFYYMAKVQSLYEQGKTAAINAGKKGKEAQEFIENLIKNPTDEMIKYASLDAETAVFQNQTALGKAARQAQKVFGGAGEIVVPFGRTPSSVAMQIINYSPLGIPKTIIESLKTGKFDQRVFSIGMGRALTGTGALGIGAYLMKNKLMTLARPTGEKEQKLWELEGKQPNSIKIGGKWRQITVFGPVGNILLIGGYIQNEFSKTGSPTEAISNTLAGIAQSFTEQTFLTGVSNFIDAVSDPSRSAASVAGSTLSSIIPTIISDISRATDTRERRAATIVDKLLARIPGIRETLEPQVNVLGEEKPTQGNVLEVIIDPTRPTPAQQTPLISELRRLWDLNYKVSPTLLGDKNGYNALTPEQNTELWKKAGEITNSKLSNLINLEAYKKLADDQKAKVIENFIDKSKLIARVGIVIEITQGLSGDQLKAKLSELKKSGLLTREVYDKWLEIR